jgi:curved DNA-binding protein CbpA
MQERDPDPYSVLHIRRDAVRAEVARAYRTLAKRHHPDLPGGGAEAMVKLNWAWHVLSDPARRAAWDAAHGGPLPAHWTPEARAQRVRPTAPGQAPGQARGQAQSQGKTAPNATWTAWEEYRAAAMREEQGMAGLSLGCIGLVIVVALLMVFVLLAGLASTAPRTTDPLQTQAEATVAP